MHYRCAIFSTTSVRSAALLGPRITYSTAPTASAASPPISCSRVAPAATPSDMAIATSGTIGPNGATNVADGTSGANAGARRRSVAALTPAYVTSRATALTTGSLAHEPDSASSTATTDVKITAFDGVRKLG